MLIQPYLSFEGRCEEALEFYKRALGAKVDMIMRFKDAPAEARAAMSPGSADKVMHAAFHIGDTLVMASDGRCRGERNFKGICLSLTVADAAEARKTFDALADGGHVEMPLGKTFFSPSFGMVNDRFGVPWMVIAPGQEM